MKNVGTLKYLLAMESLIEILTKRRSQAFYKLIDAHSVTNFRGESTSSISMFVHVERSSIKHLTSRFSVRKNLKKKKKKKKKKEKEKRKRVTSRWTDISGPGPVSSLSRSSMYYIMLTLFNSIKLLNVVSTNSFP